MFCGCLLFLVLADNVGNDEVDDGKRQYADCEADETVKDGLFAFFDFAGIAVGSHVVDATNNHDHDADNTENGDDVFEDSDDTLGEIVLGADLVNLGGKISK